MMGITRIVAAAAGLALALAGAACGSTKDSSVSDDETGGDNGGPSNGQADTASHERTFREHFGDRLEGHEVRELENRRIGAWRFFSAGREGRRPAPGTGLVAAVHEDGTILVPREAMGELYKFLSTEGMDAKQALSNLCFLFGRIPLEAGADGLEDGAGELVTDPELVREEDGTMRLVGWIASPPHADSPERLTLTAPPSGNPSIDYTPWRKVAEEGE